MLNEFIHKNAIFNKVIHFIIMMSIPSDYIFDANFFCVLAIYFHIHAYYMIFYANNNWQVKKIFHSDKKNAMQFGQISNEYLKT